jgi:purine-binding chemotaxis protein CheW
MEAIMEFGSEMLAGTYLTLYLDLELYGLSIHSVREVLEYTSVTRVPRSAESMRGVINVRGQAVPVLDLRAKFGLAEKDRTVDTCIIIVELNVQGETSVMGLLVDGVREVLDILPEKIEAASRLGSSINTCFIAGLAKLEDTFVILLNIEQLCADEELDQVMEQDEWPTDSRPT